MTEQYEYKEDFIEGNALYWTECKECGVKFRTATERDICIKCNTISSSLYPGIQRQEPYECPSCGGTGEVYNIKYGHATDIFIVKCRTCDGKKIVWK